MKNDNEENVIIKILNKYYRMIKRYTTVMTSNKAPERALIGVGIMSVIFAIFGLYYNYNTLFADYSLITKELSREYDLPNFYISFYIMSVVCITFYIVLFISGIQLIRKKTAWVLILIIVIVLEVIYFILVRFLSCNPTYGVSIAAATGVSSGGLMFQAFGLFPIWAPLIIFWARRKMIKKVNSHTSSRKSQ